MYKYMFPIYGNFTSKRGITWYYAIYEDLTVLQHQRKVKEIGGCREIRDVYAPKCTKELREYIKSKYGLDVH